MGVSYPDGHTICKIADLGTAVKLKTSSDLLTEQIGTTGYSAPEIFSTKGYSFPVDVFACGVLFWELLGTSRAMRDNVLMGRDPYEAVEMVSTLCHGCVLVLLIYSVDRWRRVFVQCSRPLLTTTVDRS